SAPSNVSIVFFQAEDGIRDLYVTGVQTCALPIWPERLQEPAERLEALVRPVFLVVDVAGRRVGDQDIQVAPVAQLVHQELGQHQIGRASCRERVEFSVVAGSLKKKCRDCAESAMG